MASASKLNTLFDKYKAHDPTGSDDDIISIDGTLKLCGDLEVDPEDVVLLAVACELKAPGVGEFTRVGWRDGWKNLGVDSTLTMKGLLPKLREKLGREFGYFKKVYLYTFDFARSEGQRSLGVSFFVIGLLLANGLCSYRHRRSILGPPPPSRRQRRRIGPRRR